MISKDLNLYEEVLLLALRDQEGTFFSSTMFSYALGGAILSELLLHKRVKSVETRWSTLLEITDPTSIGDPLLDLALEKIKQTKRRASLQTWITRFTSIRDLKHKIAHQLCRKGILREDEEKILLLFTRKIYPEVNPIPERKLIQRIHHAIFSDAREIDPRTVVLIALSHHSELLKNNFDRKELRRKKQRINEIINGNLVGKAAKEAIEAVQAAVVIAAVMPAIIATTVTSS